MREDLEMREEATKLGYGICGDWTRGESLSFLKGQVRIWRIRDGWQCADLISEGDESYYRNHRPYETLKEALEKES